MLKSKKKKPRKATKKVATDTLDLLRPGMPAKDSIQKVVDFVSPPPKGDRYKIIRTTEMDAYDPVPKPKKKRGLKS